MYRPSTFSTAFRAMSSMWPRYATSRCDIQRFSASQDLIAESRIESLRRHQVDTTPVQQLRQLPLDADKPETWHMTGLELHQNVDVAVGAKVLAKDRPEERQPADVVPPAERRDGIAVNVQVRGHGTAARP